MITSLKNATCAACCSVEYDPALRRRDEKAGRQWLDQKDMSSSVAMLFPALELCQSFIFFLILLTHLEVSWRLSGVSTPVGRAIVPTAAMIECED